MRRPTSTHARIAQVEDRAARVAEASQRRPLGDDLQEAAQRAPRRIAIARIGPCGLEQGRKGEGREEERDVEQAGSEGGHGEPAFALSAAMPSAAVPMKKM